MNRTFSKACRIWHLFTVSIIVLSLLCLVGCGAGSARTIDLKDYLTYSFEGYDKGYGFINSGLDYESFEEKLYELYSSEDAELVQGMISNLENEIDGAWDRDQALSNGDTVTYKWAVDTESIKETYHLNVICDDITAEVTGLTELGEFDPFEGLEIEVSGMAGEGLLEMHSSKYPELVFTANKTRQLSPGDKVTISLSGSDIAAACIENYQALPLSTEMTYTVGPMDTMITTVAEITPELDTSIRKQLDDYLVSIYAADDYKTLTSYDVLGYYLLSPKDKSLQNQLYIVYKCNIHSVSGDKKEEEDVVSYKYLRFSNAVKYKDGTGYVDLISYTYPSGYSGEEFRTRLYYYAGYNSLDALYSHCIASQKAEWNIDTNITPGKTDQNPKNQADTQGTGSKPE